MTCVVANFHQQCMQVNILTWYPQEKLGVYCVDRYGISVTNDYQYIPLVVNTFRSFNYP